MKESERQILQEALHKEVMRRIIILQRWFRACLMRKQYLRGRKGIITIQVLLVWLSKIFISEISCDSEMAVENLVLHYRNTFHFNNITAFAVCLISASMMSIRNFI